MRFPHETSMNETKHTLCKKNHFYLVYTFIRSKLVRVNIAVKLNFVCSILQPVVSEDCRSKENDENVAASND